MLFLGGDSSSSSSSSDSENSGASVNTLNAPYNIPKSKKRLTKYTKLGLQIRTPDQMTSIWQYKSMEGDQDVWKDDDITLTVQPLKGIYCLHAIAQPIKFY